MRRSKDRERLRRLTLGVGIIDLFLIAMFFFFGANVMPLMMLVNFPFSLIMLSIPLPPMPEGALLAILSVVSVGGWAASQFVLRR